MTPEQRVKEMYRKWFEPDHKDKDQSQMIAEAISEAVLEERQACKADARRVLIEWAFGIHETNPDLFKSLADDIDKRIDVRSEKVSPDLFGGD